MKRTTIVCLVLVIAAIAAAALYVPVAEAQTYTAVRPGGRGGTWEFNLPIMYNDSTTIDGQNGSFVDLKSSWGFGFGFGYNFNDHFQLNGLMGFNSRSYEATIVNTDGTTRQYKNWLESSTLSLNGVYYFMSGKITPFVSGGIGLAYVDTNIQTGAGSTSCWWDPWWGYVCSSYVPTKTENDLTYNAGVGVRFDIDRQFGLQAGYYKTWIDMGRASGTPDFDTWRFDLLFRM
jgi:opacity protein-like surface antigen